ncbi:hypothetical protein PLESTF_001503000 [Pleodorina starrii]|nr:hypothetical protein PLESTF_001503000 [Pleodorina starrii]
MAGLVLELLSGAPSAALVHGRLLAVLLLLSIALQRDPLWEALPQLGAALALDFAAFLAAALTGRYDTPQAVLQHLLSATAAAMAVIALTPLYNRLMPPPPPPDPRSQQQRQRHGWMRKGALAAEFVDPAALEKPLAVLPQDVFQCAERHLLPTYRQKLFCERLASALLVLTGAAWGPAAPGLAAAAAAAASLPPVLRARAAAALLAAGTASMLLLLNGLLAQLPGRLYGEYSGPINSIVTGLHVLGQMAHVAAFSPRQRSRALLVRMMAALTANLVGNEDPWFAFLVQLLTLLGLVTALDAWLWWGPPAPSAAAAAAAVSAGPFTGAPATLLAWLVPSLHTRSSSLVGRCAAAVAARGGPGGSLLGRSAAAGLLLPTLCYAVVAATGAAVHRSWSRGKYLQYYRLYRRFYLPASYGGACVTAPMPYHEVLQLRDGPPAAAAAGTATADSGSSASTAMLVIQSPRRQPSTDASQRSLTSRGDDSSGRHRPPTRRSVSLNTFVGMGGQVSGSTARLPGPSSGQGQSLRGGGAGASPLSSTASERIEAAATAAAGLKPAEAGGGAAGAAGRRPSIHVSGTGAGAASPFTAGAAPALEQKASARGSGGGAVALVGGEHGVAAAAAAARGDGAAGGPDGSRPILEFDEADVISGKINVTRQLSKLAAMGGGGGGMMMGTRDMDRFVQSLGSSSGTTSSAVAAHAGGMVGLGGFGAAGPGSGPGPSHVHGQHLPARNAPPRRSSDISYMYSSTSRPHAIRPTLSGPPNEPLTGGGGGIGGSGGGGSFLESVAASLASEDLAASASGGASGGGAAAVASGGGGGGGYDLRTGGQHQRVNRLRGVPARASSDLAAGRRSLYLPASPLHPQHPQGPQPQHTPHGPPQAPHLQQPPGGGGLLQHRLPRRSPSDVSHLGPNYNRGTRSLAGNPGAQPPPPPASSRYGAGSVLSPPGAIRTSSAAAAAAGGNFAAHQAHAAAAAALGVPAAGAHGHGGGASGLRSASFNVAKSPRAAAAAAAAAAAGRGFVAERRGPSRQSSSRQYTGMIDSTGLMLLGQNLITIGGSSGGPNHLILSSFHSPNVSGMNAVSGLSAAAVAPSHRAGRDAPAGGGAAAAAGLSGESALGREALSHLDGTGGLDGDPFGTVVSSLEPVRGLRANRGIAEGGGVAATPAAAVALAGPGPGAESSAAAAAPVPAGGAEAASARRKAAGEDADVGRGAAHTPPAQPPAPQQPSRLSSPSSLAPSPPWHQQRRRQQQEEPAPPAPPSPPPPQQQQPPPLLLPLHGQLEPSPLDALGRLDSEPQLGGSLSFRRVVESGWLPAGPSTDDDGGGGGGAAAGGADAGSTVTSGPGPSSAAGADASSIRSKTLRVSWSDMEARASGGSTGTDTLLTTASEASKVSTAGTDPASASASGGTAAVAAAATAPTAAAAVAASGQAGRGAAVGGSSRLLQRPRPFRVGPSIQPAQFEMYGGAPTAAGDGPAGSGEASDTSMVVEMEQMRAARELAAMWTSSSVGEVSSQMVPSTQSSLAVGAAAAFAAGALGARPSELPVAAPLAAAASDGSGGAAGGGGRILSAVQEVLELPEAMPASELPERRCGTRQRRLSQVISPGPLLAAATGGGGGGGGSRPGSRAVQHPSSHLQLQQRLGGLHLAAAAAAAAGAAAGAAGVSTSDDSPPAILSGSAAVAALAAQMSHTVAGGSVSSVAGAGSTAMSFDNWATADDLAAMLLGPAGGGAAGASDLSGPYSAAGSSAKRPLAFQPGRPPALQAPQLPPSTSPLPTVAAAAAAAAGAPGQAGLPPPPPSPQEQQQHPPSGSGVAALAPRVPARTPSLLGPGNDGSGRGGGGGGSGYTARGGAAGAAGGRADIAVVLDHIAGAPRYAAQMQLPSGSPPSQDPLWPSQPQVAWGDADRDRDRVMPLRSPSVPNMGARGARGLNPGSVRRTSSMGKSRLGSMSSASSGTLGFLNTTAGLSASPIPGTATPSAGQLHMQPPPQPHQPSPHQLQQHSFQPRPRRHPQLRAPLSPRTAAVAAAAAAAAGRISTPQLPLRASTLSQVPDGDLAGPAGTGSAFASRAGGWEDSDPLDSYAHLPPMRASQTQLALAMPASSLRGSVVGRGGGAVVSGPGGVGGGGGPAAGVGGAGMMGLARGLAAAGATVSGPVGWAADMQRQQQRLRRVPFRRSSLDERLFKQVVTARLLNTPSAAAAVAAAARNRGRRRSVSSLTSLEYIPSRLSQDGKALRAAAQAGVTGTAAVAPAAGPALVTGGGAATGAASSPAPLAAAAAGPPSLGRSRSLSLPQETHIRDRVCGPALGRGLSPAPTPMENHRASVVSGPGGAVCV